MPHNRRTPAGSPNYRANWQAAAAVLAAPLAILLWTRLRRTAVRFTALAAQLRAGTLPRATRRRGPASARRAPRRPLHNLPRRFGWLIPFAPEATCYGGQLRHLLSDPEMQALLSAPQVRRLLRPLGRMLGIQVPNPDPPPPDGDAPSAANTPLVATERPPNPAPAPTPAAPSAAFNRLRPPFLRPAPA